jgi:hypothetical protein
METVTVASRTSPSVDSGHPRTRFQARDSTWYHNIDSDRTECYGLPQKVRKG